MRRGLFTDFCIAFAVTFHMLRRARRQRRAAREEI